MRRVRRDDLSQDALKNADRDLNGGTTSALSMFVIDAVANSFRLGIQIAAPVLIFSLIFNMSLGLVSRLLPQIQVFMIAMPLSVLLGVAVTALGLGGGMMVWLDEMERQARFLTIR